MANAREKALSYLEKDHLTTRTDFVTKYESIIRDISDGKEIEETRYNELFLASKNLDSHFIPYSEITRIIYSLNSMDGLDMFYTEIEKRLLNYLNIHKDMRGTFMVKVIEHTKLASKQFDNLYARSENEIQSLTTNAQKLIKQQNSINDRYKEIKTENQHLSSNLITILGMFTAITFAIFGGLQLLGNVFGNAISDKGTSHFVIGNSIILGGFFVLSIYVIMLILFEGIGKLTKQDLGLSIKTMIITIIVTLLIVLAGYVYSRF